ncbi:MAG: zinc ribbon domain-containing protein [Treponema sp.]|nr:zinc ribbon domain-containing protein [Treponema sp.]
MKSRKAKFFCENCGAEVPQNAKFCRNCGRFLLL